MLKVRLKLRFKIRFVKKNILEIRRVYDFLAVVTSGFVAVVTQ